MSSRMPTWGEPVVRPKLNRRKLGREHLPRMISHELQAIPETDRIILAPILGDLFAMNGNPLIVDARKMAELGMDDYQIAAAWDISEEELDLLRSEHDELDKAIRIGRSKHSTKQYEEENSAFHVNISKEDLDNLDTNKLKEGMYKGIYALEAALFGQAGFEFQRVSKIRNVITTLEADILDPEAVADLTKNEKLAFYDQMNKSMRSSMTFLAKLHDSVASSLEAVSSVEKHKQAAAISPSKGESLEEKEVISEAKTLILQKLREKVEEERRG